jgi:hypothetical protein
MYYELSCIFQPDSIPIAAVISAAIILISHFPLSALPHLVPSRSIFDVIVTDTFAYLDAFITHE